MTETFAQQDGNDELWSTVFGVGHPDLLKQHKLHRMLPRDPRCRMCMAPFKGLGGWWLGKRGKAPSSRNPHYCSACDGFLEAFPGGAEVEMSILFVDIRESVAFAQGAAPADVSRRVTGFLDVATKTITDNDGFIMAFYGDCVVAVWPPGFAGPDHAAKAVAAAQALIGTAIHDASGVAINVGVGVHTGLIYIGTVRAAKGLFRDVSVFGHAVNLCARLAGVAPAAAALVSEQTVAASGQTLDVAPLQVALKGIEDAPAVATLR